MEFINIKTHYFLRKTYLGGLILLFPIMLFAQMADAFWLVTPEEYLKSSQEPALSEEVFFEKSFGAPEITLVSPQLGKKGVSSPMKIELLFEPSADSNVVPESFKILYGMFKIDITDRILEHAKVTDKGIVASNAKLPVGEHSIALEISDNLGRKGRKKLTLLVIE